MKSYVCKNCKALLFSTISKSTSTQGTFPQLHKNKKLTTTELLSHKEKQESTVALPKKSLASHEIQRIIPDSNIVPKLKPKSQVPAPKLTKLQEDYLNEKRESYFILKSSEVMVHAPITVSNQAFAETDKGRFTFVYRKIECNGCLKNEALKIKEEGKKTKYFGVVISTVSSDLLFLLDALLLKRSLIKEDEALENVKIIEQFGFVEKFDGFVKRFKDKLKQRREKLNLLLKTASTIEESIHKLENEMINLQEIKK